MSLKRSDREDPNYSRDYQPLEESFNSCHISEATGEKKQSHLTANEKSDSASLGFIDYNKRLKSTYCNKAALIRDRDDQRANNITASVKSLTKQALTEVSKTGKNKAVAFDENCNVVKSKKGSPACSFPPKDSIQGRRQQHQPRKRTLVDILSNELLTSAKPINITPELEMKGTVLRCSSDPDRLHAIHSEGIRNGNSPRKLSLPVSLNEEDALINSYRTKVIDGMECHKRITDDNCSENDWNPKHRASEFKLRDQLFSFFQASDNKLAMKLFGSRNALLKEKRRQKEARSWIIHPCSNFRLYWDLLMLIFLITNLIVLPVSIAFFYDDVGMHWLVFNITCDAMFLLDILINFRTGLIDSESHGNVILDSKVIATRYLKSWFVVDLLSSLPLDYAFLEVEDKFKALRILRVAKLLQLLRLLRISRLVRYVRLWQEYFSIANVVMRIFNLICVMVLMAHWSGCIQFFVPVVQGLPDDCWIMIDQIQNLTWWDQYSRSLFKAMSHMLSIGYGQYAPRNTTDTWLTMSSMLAGAMCYALFIGHTSALIQSFDTSSRQFRDHLQQVNEYMIYRKLPSDLRRRITDYFEHRYGGKMFDEAAILTEMSACLRQDVINHNCRELIANVPFFVNADPNFVMDVITKLQFEMFQPGDVIIKAETDGDKMYFIQEGVVEILSADGVVITRLGDGSYFGEVSLLTEQRRTATVKSVSYCGLFSLSKENFDHILECYPVMRDTLVTVAAQRLRALGLDPNMVLSQESLLNDVLGIHRVFQGSMDMEDDSNSECDQQSSTTQSKDTNSQFLTVVKGFFTKDSEIFSTSRSPSHRSSLSKAGMSRCASAVNQLVLVPNETMIARRNSSLAEFSDFQNGLPHKEKPRNDTSPEDGVPTFYISNPLGGSSREIQQTPPVSISLTGPDSTSYEVKDLDT